MLQFCLLLGLVACGPQKEAETPAAPREAEAPADPRDAETTETPVIKEVASHAEPGTGFVVGNLIQVLDDQLTEIPVSEDLRGAEVEILRVSDQRYPEDGEYCDQFHYVKIAYGKLQGWINGRQIFKVTPSNQDTIFELAGKQYKIETTDFYGMGPFEDGDPTECFDFSTPIVMEELGTENRGLVKLRASAAERNHFPYFELAMEVDVYDEITGISQDGENIVLELTRHYQDTPEKRKVILSRYGKGYQAETKVLE